MKVFISDLHMGDGSRTDDFHRDKELLKFLEFVEREAEELVVVGDLFELWQAKLDKILFKHIDVVNKLLTLRKKLKVTYVIGNHDYIPFARLVKANVGIQIEYRDEENGIVAEHGNRYDVFNRYKNPLRSIKWPPGRYFTVFLAGLERLINPNIDTWFRNTAGNVDDFLREAALIRNKVTPSSKEYLTKGGHFGEFEKAVRAHMRKGAKIVIFGHTHKAQLNVIGDGIYANCGSWVDSVDPTYIAYSDNKIVLREALTHKSIKSLVV